jgi:hypothetical protein
MPILYVPDWVEFNGEDRPRQRRIGDPVKGCVATNGGGLLLTRFAGPRGDPLGIAAAQRLRVGQVEGESGTSR